MWVLEPDNRIKSFAYEWCVGNTVNLTKRVGYNKGIYLEQLFTKFSHPLPDVFQPFVKLGWDHVIIKWEWGWSSKSCDWPPFFLVSCCLMALGGHIFMEALDHVLPKDTRRFPVDTWCFPVDTCHFPVAPPALEQHPVHIQVVNLTAFLNKSAPTRKVGKWSIFLLKICRIDFEPLYYINLLGLP